MKAYPGKINQIKVVHRPEQKGEWKDYYLALYEGDIGEGETEELAKKDLIKKSKAFS